MKKSIKKNKPLQKVKNDTYKLSDQTLSKNKLWAFRILTIVLSVLFVFIFEAILHLSGFGHDLSLFAESKEDQSCWQMSEHAADKFFTDEENRTIGSNERFKKKKESDTYRIFVLGESTTAGFPYMVNGSFHRWLKYRLMFAFPEKNFEIINLALTAVSSYTIADFAKQIVGYQPDAVLIYVGHNEYYGALGVGSTSRMGRNPFIIRSVLELENLRIFQLFVSSKNRIKRIISDTGSDTAKGLMERMSADKDIQFESKEYKLGISQFSNNIDRTLKILSSHNIPVFISNIVSNEKDMVPFISDSSNKDNSAMYQYNLATEAYKAGDFTKAKKLFVKAKELDLLRFRAPEAINENILELSRKYSGVNFVDSKSYFEKASPHGIIGNETLVEHVHPNLYGYALLSEAFFESMKNTRLLSSDWGKAMSFQELLNQMPITPIDSLAGEYKIRFMKNSWPFTNNPVSRQTLIKPETEIENIAYDLVNEKITWVRALINLGGIYFSSGDKTGALKVSEALVLEYPSTEESYKSAADFSLGLNDVKKAIFYFSKAFRLNPNYAAARQLSMLCIDIDEPEKAMKYLDYMKSSGDKPANLELTIKLVEDIVKLKASLPQNRNDVNLLNTIALNYFKIDQFHQARLYAENALRIDANNTNTKSILSKINALNKEYSGSIN
jgi:tetratricopeptide (TPR) repeat protein